MQLPARILAIPLLALLVACDNDDNDPPASGPASNAALLEVIHASPDAPDVQLSLDGEPVGDPAPFKAVAASQVTADTTSVEVEGLLPSGPATVIGPVDVPTPDGERVTVFAAGEVAAIEALVVTAPQVELAAGETRVRVVHAAPNAPMVDVYVTAPDAALDGASPTGTAMFRGDFGPLTVASGDYRIRVTPAGDAATVVFDSGTVALEDGADLVIAAIDNTVTGDAPITLLVSDGAAALELLDADTPADVRVVHASPDAPNVDVLVDDATPPAVADLAYGDFTGYLPLPPATYNFKVTETGTTTPAVIDADLDLAAGFAYSVYAAGLLADIQPLVLVDDNRPVATEARLRVVHASPSAGDVDVYLVEAGTDLSTVDAAVPGLTFLDDSGYLSVEPGSYDVVVTGAGSTTAAIGPAPVTLAAGGVYTAAARDTDGGGAPFALILLDDF